CLARGPAANGREERYVTVWDADRPSPRPLARFAAVPPDGPLLALHPRGTTLAAALEPMRLGLRNIGGVPGPQRLQVREPAVLGSQQGEVCVARVADGSRVATLTPHGDDVTGMTFSGNGRLLATAGLDGRIHLYLCREGSFRSLLTLRAPGPVVSLGLAPDG